MGYVRPSIGTQILWLNLVGVLASVWEICPAGRARRRELWNQQDRWVTLLRKTSACGFIWKEKVRGQKKGRKEGREGG